MNTKIIFKILTFNDFKKTFNKLLMNLIIYISIKTWNTWFDPLMCHPRNMEHSSYDKFSALFYGLT